MKTKTTHTPGHGTLVRREASCGCCENLITREDDAFFRAAPELLDAARNVLEWMEIALPKFNGPLDVGNATHQIALRAAIAKAEGR